MKKLLILTAIAAATVVSMSAGTLQYQVNLSGSNLGVTNEAGWLERNYNKQLFDNAVFTPASGPATSPLAYTMPNYQQNAAVAGTLTDSNTSATGVFQTGVQFNMLNDGCGSTSAGLGNACVSGASSNNFWVAPQTSTGQTSSFVIPIGLYDVTDVWTMLSNTYGAGGAMNTSVTFEWGSSATVVDHSLDVTVALTNAAAGTSASGQVQSGVSCTGPMTSTCLNEARSPLSPYTDFLVTSGANSGDIGVLTNNLYSFTFNSVNVSGSNPFTGATSGTVNLNDQGFIFSQGLNSNKYLVAITINELSGVSNVSSTAISAVTVDYAPEPASIWLGVTGLVMAMGISRVRRRRSSERA